MDGASHGLRGLMPDETAHLVTRAHPWRLICGAGPCMLSGVGLVAALYCQGSGIFAGPLWSASEVLLGLLAALLLVRWAITDAYPWWYTLFIITDQRVVRTFHGLTHAEQEIFVGKIQAVRASTGTFWQWALGLGTVEINGTGDSQIRFTDIAAPRQVAALLLGLKEAATPPTVPSLALIDDPALQAVLDDLAQPEPLPAAAALPGDQRRHWPLSRAVQVPLEPDEVVLGVVSRHWWVLITRARVPGLLLGAALLMGWLTLWAHQMALGVVGGLLLLGAAIAALVVYLDFADDIFMLTTQRVIDVERRYFVLFEAQLALPYHAIQSVDVQVTSVWERFLGIGRITLTTAAVDLDDIVMDAIAHPQAIAATIDRSRAAFKQHEAVTASNQRKDDAKAWFAAMVGELVAVAPELRGQTLPDAYARAVESGLRVMVQGESVAIPGYPAGRVVSQIPQAGARCLRGGEIAVVLSRL